MNDRFPQEVERVLRSSGWTGGPKSKIPVAIPKAIELFPEAERILREFGGILYNPSIVKGMDFPREAFHISPPKDYDGLSSCYAEEESAIGHRLYPIGELLDQPIDLLIAEDGTPYQWSGYGLYQIADTFDNALSSLILGKLPEAGFTNYPIFDRNAKPGEKGMPCYDHLAGP